MPDAVIYSSNGAKLSVSNELLPLFRPAERKALYQKAMTEIVTRWYNEYGPLRFTRYAFAKLPMYKFKGGDDGIPFHESGETKSRYLLFSRVSVSGTGRGATGRLIGNLPKYLNYKDLFRAFVSIPENERESLVKWYGDALLVALSGASSKIPTRTAYVDKSGATRSRRGRRSKKIFIAGGAN